MATKSTLVGVSGESLKKALPKIKSVHPFGSKILVACLKGDEILGSNLILSENTEVGGAPQAYIVEMGPQVPTDCGLKVGQRVYWTGKGTQVDDPRETNGRVRAMLEIHNILGVMEELVD